MTQKNTKNIMNTIQNCPLISVVVATFNCGSSIRELLDSYKSQSYSNKELILIDGGSSDDTIDVVKEYGDNITYMISEPDHGVYDAINKGMAHVSGDFLIVMGADDHFISSSVLSDVAGHISDMNTVYYGDVYRNARNDLYRGRFNKWLLACENICHQAIFYPRSVYSTNKYDLAFPVFADYVYNIRLWNKVGFRYIPVCVSYYNCTGMSGVGTRDPEKYSPAFFDEVRKHLGFFCFLLRRLYKLTK